MRNMFKKMSIVVALIAVIAVTMVPSHQVSAATKLVKNYDFTLVGNSKTYTYKMPKSGYFYYKIVLKDVKEKWNEEFVEKSWGSIEQKMDVNYKNYEDKYVYYGTPYTSEKYAFKKDTKIKIKLCTDYYDEDRYTCSLKIYSVTPKNFEKESNNSKKNATNMKLNTTYTGLVHPSDKDWWVFKAPKAGKYKMSTVAIGSGSQYDKVYKGSKLRNCYNIYPGDGWKTVFSGKLKKGEKIYLLSADGEKNNFYKLKVSKIK